jgi:hypothetical protein
VFGLISLICKAGLVRGIYTANNNQSVGIKEHVKFGWKKLLPMFMLELFFAIPTIVLSLVGLLVVNLTAAAWPFTLVLLILMLYMLFVWVFKNFAYCALCYDELKPFKAIVAGWTLFKNKIRETLLVALLRLAVIVSFLIATTILSLMFEGLFAALAYATVRVDSEVAFTFVRYLSIVIGAVITWGILMIENSYLYTLMSKTYLGLK